MKFFIDTSDLEQIRSLQKQMPIDGVTTNPSLIAQSGQSIHNVIPKICDLVNRPVSAEVIETEEEPMFQEALILSQLHSQVVVKIPLTTNGLKVVSRLTKKGIPTNVTLCFSALQALMAAKAGAQMVSVFVGRLDDIHQSGMQVVSDVLDIFSNYQLSTQVLVASIRNKEHILQSALLGAHMITAPYKVLTQLSKHPLTDIGLEQFLASYRQSKK